MMTLKEKLSILGKYDKDFIHFYKLYISINEKQYNVYRKAIN